MDTTSAAEAARMLGTSTPRVVRTLDRLGLESARGKNGRFRLTEEIVRTLRDELGCTPHIEGLGATEVRALGSLARHPLGLSSARVLSRQAGISPTAATHALMSLEHKGLVWREATKIAAGRARPVTLIHANRHGKDWPLIQARLIAFSPARKHGSSQRTVPGRLRHLFWNTAPAQLDVATSGPYIARRLLTMMDFDGLAWGTDHLSPSDWTCAARGRGALEAVRGDREAAPKALALARNLARARERHLRGEKDTWLGADGSAQALCRLNDVYEPCLASLRSFMATKLRSILDRPKLRDFYDLMIAEGEGVPLEDAFAAFMEACKLSTASSDLRDLVRALGYLDDAEEYDAVPMSKPSLTEWWCTRQVEFIRNLARNPL